MSKSYDFDMELVYDGESIRVEGSIDPGEKETGPTYDCGGTPGCGPSIEDFKAYSFVPSAIPGCGAWVEIADTEAILKALEDEIMETVYDELCDDGPDPDEKHDADMSGD